MEEHTNDVGNHCQQTQATATGLHQPAADTANLPSEQGTRMKITEIIPFLESHKTDVKIHCATKGPKDPSGPLAEFQKGKFKEWQEIQTAENFKRNYIFSIIGTSKGEWLFAGIYERIGEPQKQKDKESGDDLFIYRTRLLDYGKELIGKLVVTFKKEFRNSYPLFENFGDELTLCEIKREKYQFDPFPGYNNVHIPFELLKGIIENNESTWKTALSNVKGIYLISDRKTGKFYVGSASGEKCFWQRWHDYVKDGHAGNERLKPLIKTNGYEYSSNFMFSILEIFNLNTPDDEIGKRETFWKKRLLTREFGYNDN